MEHKRVKWLDRDYKWMEQMDFHISSNKSVEGLFVKMYTQNQCTTENKLTKVTSQYVLQTCSIP